MAANNQNMRGAADQQARGQMGGESRSSQSSVKSGTSKRGFASMDPEQQRRIASEGGKASHASGRGHEWTSAEAREAGRKGGMSSNRSKGSANNGR